MDTNLLFEEFEKEFASIPAYDINLLKSDNPDVDLLKLLFSCIDLTSLNSTDSSNSIDEFCDRVVSFKSAFPDFSNVAAVCVYPVFASILATKLKRIGINRAVVSGGFPSSQTFLETKLDECKRAVYFGANEVDIVISVGEMLEGNYEFVAEEIASIKSSLGNDVHLKVILETGLLSDPKLIWKASLLAMNSGADFIKTSTGKASPAATPEAAWIMTHAIKAFTQDNDRVVGFKPAGGIVTVEDALLYWRIQEYVLGEKWMNPERFRIGASRLANNLLSAVAELEGRDANKATWF